MSERPAAAAAPDPGSGSGSGSAGPGVRPPLAERALSEAYSRLRYRDVSLLIWQQQQQQQQQEAPPTFLSRSQSAWYSNYGNQAVLIRDTRGMRDPGGSKICSIM